MTSSPRTANADDVGILDFESSPWYTVLSDLDSVASHLGKAQLGVAFQQHRVALGPKLAGELAREEFASGGVYL